MQQFRQELTKGAWLKKPRILVSSATTAAAVLAAVLGLFGVLKPESVSWGIVALLAVTASTLVTISHWQEEMREILKRLPNPSAGNVLKPFEDYMKDIEEKLKSARKVWILTRTGQGLWPQYEPELRAVLQEPAGEVRLMLISPEDGAVKMIAGSADVRGPNPGSQPLVTGSPGQMTYEMVQHNIRWTLHSVNGLRAELPRPQSLQINTIDYLPAWTLVLIDPETEYGSAYVEIGTFRANPRNRPTFVLRADTDKRWFEMFREEYLTMWAKSWGAHMAPQAGGTS